jgi:hypothetical protein
MGRYVNIVRGTPELAQAWEERWKAIATGKAPKAVLDALTKVKIITLEISLANGFALWVTEVKDEDWLEVQKFIHYFTDVVKMEMYPVISLEDFNKLMLSEWK